MKLASQDRPGCRTTPAAGFEYYYLAVKRQDEPHSAENVQLSLTKICILDFDQAFLAEDPPGEVSYIPVPYLAPESIFALTNTPAADVWALGCILFNLRYPMQLFWDFYSSDLEATAGQMHHTLGHLPQKWMTKVLFLDGWPVHEELEPGSEDTPKPIKLLDNNGSYSLEQFVDGIREARRPASSQNPRTGLERFFL